VVGSDPQVLAVQAVNGRILGAAEPRGAADQRVQHRRKLARRAGDGAQHLRGRRLLLSRLG
jgi:hypothetical protein